MKTLSIILLIIFSFNVKAQDKIILFNGKNLDGWNLISSDKDVQAETIFKAEDGVIKISGSTNGYLRTENVFTNYNLHIEWRWTEKPTNSGVLLHVNGYDFWPNAIEAQLQDQHAGDIVFIGWGVSGMVSDSSYINLEKRYRVIPKLKSSNEKKAGEWNSYDIDCNNDNVTLRVNGESQNQASKLSLTSGSIGLQSEGSPIEFRNIYITK